MRGRPAIVHLKEDVHEDRARIIISLDWSEEIFDGVAAGSPDPASRPRLIGEATLRAIELVTAGKLELELAAIATSYLGDLRVAMAQVRLPATGQSFVGNAVLGENDPSLATVKAVLDAVNRQITRMLTPA